MAWLSLSAGLVLAAVDYAPHSSSTLRRNIAKRLLMIASAGAASTSTASASSRWSVGGTSFKAGARRRTGVRARTSRQQVEVIDVTTIEQERQRRNGGSNEWSEAVKRGRYEARSLTTEGFIHCSDRGQVIRVANSIFRSTGGLLLLHIDRERLRSPVVYENLEGGTEMFPHVYGPINLDAVRRVTPFEPAEDGSFDHHAAELEPAEG